MKSAQIQMQTVHVQTNTTVHVQTNTSDCYFYYNSGFRMWHGVYIINHLPKPASNAILRAQVIEQIKWTQLTILETHRQKTHSLYCPEHTFIPLVLTKEIEKPSTLNRHLSRDWHY